MTAAPNKYPLLQKLLEIKDREGCSLASLSVLAQHLDPFRAPLQPKILMHAEWFAERFNAAGFSAAKPTHGRDFHYVLSELETILPSGERYQASNHAHATLCQESLKLARWLGLVDFEAVTDERNEEGDEIPLAIYETPTFEVSAIDEEGRTYFYPGDLPRVVEIADLTFQDRYPLTVDMSGQLRVPQKYRLVLHSEKSSARPILREIAGEVGAATYVMTGEISATRLYQVAKRSVADGRELVFVATTDCDPAGWRMVNTIAHNLRALKEFKFPDFEYRIVHAAIRPDQVKKLKLPSAPLSDNEKTESTNEAWERAFGVGQTELNALTVLKPDTARKLVRSAIQPYFDKTLSKRIRAASDDAMAAAEHLIARYAVELNEDDAAERGTLRRLHDRTRWAAERFNRGIDRARRAHTLLNGRVRELNLALYTRWARRRGLVQEQVDRFDRSLLPEIEIPEPKAPGSKDIVIDSRVDLLKHIRSLIHRKSFFGVLDDVLRERKESKNGK